MASRVLLVTGATGQQGGAVVDALLASNASPVHTILAVTRNPDSPAARKLAARSSAIKLLKGDLADPAPLFRNAREVTQQPIWAVFSVQTFGTKAGTAEEERQGKALIDESIKNGVEHFVQTTAERGGDDKSWTSPTHVPHFISKHNIELHLRDQTAKAGGSMSWTILRPTAFMDNFMPNFGSKVFLAALKNNLGQKPLQFVAVKDIGIIAAQAMLDPENPTYKNKALGLAGDSLNVDEIVRVFREKSTSVPAPTFAFLGSALMWAVPEMGDMIKWFKSDGFNADVEKCKALNPQMMDFKTWIEQSKWPKKN